MTGNPSSGGVGEASLIKIMDKKTYIAPEMEVLNIEPIEMVATSLGMYDAEADKFLGTSFRDTHDDLW